MSAVRVQGQLEAGAGPEQRTFLTSGCRKGILDEGLRAATSLVPDKRGNRVFYRKDRLFDVPQGYRLKLCLLEKEEYSTEENSRKESPDKRF